MSSTNPTHEDVERLVTAVLRGDEFAARVEDVRKAGLPEGKIVDRIWTEWAQIWETASSAAVELRGMQARYDLEVKVRLESLTRREQLKFRDAKIVVFTTLPMLVSLYFVARYVDMARTAVGSLLDAKGWPLTVGVTGIVIALVLLSVASRELNVTPWPERVRQTVETISRYLFLNALALAVLLAILYAVNARDITHARFTSFFSVPTWVVLTITILLVANCLVFYYFRRERLEDVGLSRYEFEEEPEFVEVKQRIAAQEQKIEEIVTTQGIKPRIREMLEQWLDPPFSEHLPKLDFSGLAEVFNSANEVATEAKRNLEFMLKTMPGGSIGIAGPRGSGKSTLLRSACKERPDTLTKDKVIPLLTSSPVEYDGREFILHLFSSMCDKVLVLTGGNKNAHRPVTDVSELNTSATNAILNVLRAFALPALVTGIGLISLSTYLALITMDAPPASLSTAAAQSTPTPAQGLNIAPSPEPTPVATTVPTPTPVATPTTFVRLLRAFDLKPGTLFISGLVLSLPFWLIFIFDRSLPPLRVRRVVDEEAETITNLPLDVEIMKRLREARHSARKWLRDIKFQQSYTSGWAGAIKLPIGLEGGMNDAVTLAQQQLSLPDITNGFSDFVSGLARDFNVIIGIDELDKLESDDAAQRFLNEIKAVFGLSKVFYLISVSENAMSNFERRGMPFRDVFDSSFDNIVYVDYLTLENARRLIARRVVAMPPPFVHLCFCISGGLARDLVRTCRNLMQFSHKAYEADASGEDSNLKTLSAQLIKSDLRLKLHALTVVARKVAPGPALDGFLNTVQSLESQLDSAPSLIHAYVNLLKAAQPIVTRNGRNGKSKAPRATPDKQILNESAKLEDAPKIAVLNEELATYLYYCVTVLQFFSDVLNAQKMERAEKEKVFDDLARARQFLAINASITRTMLSTFRASFEMEVPTVDVTT